MTRLYASAAALFALGLASGCAEGSDGMRQSESPVGEADSGAIDAGDQGAKDSGSDTTNPGEMDASDNGGSEDRDAGMDAGKDLGLDASTMDAGFDAGPVDAGFDAGPAVLPPDLILNSEVIAASVVLVDETTPSDSCYVAEGCAEGVGTRRFLQFALSAENVGEGDAVFGDPRTAPGFRVAACSGEEEYEYFTRFELYDAANTMVRYRYGFGGCLADAAGDAGVAGDAGTDSRFSCDYQGIPAGGAVLTEVGTPCQWLDVTGLAGGEYQLVAIVNPWRRFAETDFANNSVRIPITIPTPPPPSGDTVLGACSDGGTGRARDCGWAVADQGLTCTPGESVTTTCGCGGGTCTGDTVMRICDGEGPCVNSVAIGSGDDDCGLCSRAAFTCPASGVYTILVGAYNPANAYTCDPVVLDGTTEPPAGDPTGTCPSGTSSGRARDCGWTVPANGRAVSCRPGESITSACGCSGQGSCTGDTVMRICNGGEPCLNAVAIGSGDDECGLCSSSTFACPASGEFTVMVGPYNPTGSATCEPAIIRETPLDPLAACTGDQTGGGRDCGWSLAPEGPGQTCTPGSTISATCGCGGGVCEGDTLIRACDGTGACLAADAIGAGDDDCGLCSKASFECPASGTYTLMVGSYKPANAFVCEPAITEQP